MSRRLSKSTTIPPFGKINRNQNQLNEFYNHIHQTFVSIRRKNNENTQLFKSTSDLIPSDVLYDKQIRKGNRETPKRLMLVVPIGINGSGKTYVMNKVRHHLGYDTYFKASADDILEQVKYVYSIPPEIGLRDVRFTHLFLNKKTNIPRKGEEFTSLLLARAVEKEAVIEFETRGVNFDEGWFDKLLYPNSRQLVVVFPLVSFRTALLRSSERIQEMFDYRKSMLLYATVLKNFIEKILPYLKKKKGRLIFIPNDSGRSPEEIIDVTFGKRARTGNFLDDQKLDAIEKQIREELIKSKKYTNALLNDQWKNWNARKPDLSETKQFVNMVNQQSK